MSDWHHHIVQNYSTLREHTERSFVNGLIVGLGVSSTAGAAYQALYKQTSNPEDYVLPLIGILVTGALKLYLSHKSKDLQEFHATLSELDKSRNLSGRELEDLLRDRDI